MVRLRGRAPSSERLVEHVPHGHWKTTTFVAGLRMSGVVAPLVIDGSVDGDLFRAYVHQQLVPVLKPGDIVILDNLSSHKVPGIADAIERAGASIMPLPPYSPDLNPIEMYFAKLKAQLRKARKGTIEELWATIGQLVDEVSLEECENFIRHCGYTGSGTG